MKNKYEGRLAMTEFKTNREAARYLRVSEITLWRLRTKKDLPFHRVCSKVLYDVRDLEAFMAEHKHNGGTK